MSKNTRKNKHKIENKFSLFSCLFLALLLHINFSFALPCNTITLYLANLNSNVPALYLVDSQSNINQEALSSRPSVPQILPYAGGRFLNIQIDINPNTNASELKGQLSYGDKPSNPSYGCILNFSCALTQQNGQTLCVSTQNNPNPLMVSGKSFGMGNVSSCDFTVISQPFCDNTGNKNAQARLEIK